MLTLRHADERGRADHGWLRARHTFSFAEYHDPDFMGFSVLRVLNQDIVQPGQGFGTHRHHDMEIVTYVLRGVLQHRDSMGNGSTIRPGEVQLMAAGRGVTHSEFNGSGTEPLELLQMWILPATKGSEPRYEQKDFSADVDGHMALVVSPDGRDGSLTIGQDACLYTGRLGPADTARLELDPTRAAWLHVARGHVELNGRSLHPGDGVAVRDEAALELRGLLDANNPDTTGPAAVVLWDLPGD